MANKPTENTEEQIRKLIEHSVKILETHNIEPGESYHPVFWKTHREFLVKKILSQDELCLRIVIVQNKLGDWIEKRNKYIPLAPIIKKMEAQDGK